MFLPHNLLCQEGIMSTPFDTKVLGCTGDDRWLSRILQSKDILLVVFIVMRLSNINFVDISFHSFIHFDLHTAHQNWLSFYIYRKNRVNWCLRKLHLLVQWSAQHLPASDNCLWEICVCLLNWKENGSNYFSWDSFVSFLAFMELPLKLYMLHI